MGTVIQGTVLGTGPDPGPINTPVLKINQHNSGFRKDKS